MLHLRWATLGTSVALHAAVGLAAGGHDSNVATPTAGPDVIVPIELLPSPPAPAVAEGSGSDEPREPTRPAARTHKHDYPVAPGHDRPHDPSIVHVAKSPAVEPIVVAAASIDEVAPKEPPVRFVLGPSSALVSLGGGAGKPGPTGFMANAAAESAETTLPESQVSAPARVVSIASVVYPIEARAAEIERDVPLDIVVDRTGAVVEARALSHEGYGLEDAAVRAIRSYRFSPAEREGHAVRVRMRWTVQFRLR